MRIHSSITIALQRNTALHALPSLSEFSFRPRRKLLHYQTCMPWLILGCAPQVLDPMQSTTVEKALQSILPYQVFDLHGLCLAYSRFGAHVRLA